MPSNEIIRSLGYVVREKFSAMKEVFNLRHTVHCTKTLGLCLMHIHVRTFIVHAHVHIFNVNFRGKKRDDTIGKRSVHCPIKRTLYISLQIFTFGRKYVCYHV
jgi:hypothetical protein